MFGEAGVRIVPLFSVDTATHLVPQMHTQERNTLILTDGIEHLAVPSYYWVLGRRNFE